MPAHKRGRRRSKGGGRPSRPAPSDSPGSDPIPRAASPVLGPRPRALAPSGGIVSRALPRAGRTIRMLLRLILPISLGVALLRWTGALDVVGRVCAPVMGIFHLPGETAVVLLSGFLGGIYGLIGAAAAMPIGAAEFTVIGAMALLAHNLIVECAVQDKAGAPWWWMLSVRLLAAAAVGIIVSFCVTGLQSIHAPALWLRLLPYSPRTVVPAGGDALFFLRGWIREAVRTSIKVCLIVTAMMFVTEWVRSAGIMERLERLCRPALRFFGLADSLAYAWLTGQILGVAFGSALLVEEFQESSAFRPRDVRDLHTSIGLNHSILEDTILLVGLGASLFWIIVPRLLLAALAVRILRPLRWGLRPRGIPDGHELG